MVCDALLLVAVQNFYRYNGIEYVMSGLDLYEFYVSKNIKSMENPEKKKRTSRTLTIEIVHSLMF